MGSESEEGRIKIPIRDKRKLYDDGAAPQGGAVGVDLALVPDGDLYATLFFL